MKVAIITLNYNGKKDTLELLRSINDLRLTRYDLKVVVVDNDSSDNSVSDIHKAYPNVDVLQAGGNLGFSAGFNKGFEYAKVWGADYFLMINNDTIINDSDLIEQLIRTVEFKKGIGLVSPKIYFAPGFEFHKDRYSLKDVGHVIWYAGGNFDWNNMGNVHKGLDEVDAGQFDEIEESEIFSGACVLIKKEVLEKVGLLNEEYFLYFEDSEFAKRCKDAGFKIYYNGKLSIYHKVSQSTGIGSSITDYFHTRNRLIFGMRYGSFKTKFALLRQAAWTFLFGRKSQRKGILDFYLGTSPVIKQAKPIYPLKLSIGIVNYNTPDLTFSLLESIFKSDSGFDKDSMEVIVLDNGLEFSSKQAIKEYLPKIKYLENEKNEGFSKGYNKTIKYSLGEYYLMLNSDIEVLENGLSELVKAADDFSGNAVLGGKLVFPDKSNQDSAFHLPTITGALQQYFLNKEGSYFMYLPKNEKPSRVEGLVMACFLIPKRILNKVGLLDEGTFIFFEDIEYCRRLKKLGIPLYFVPSSKFIHHHGASTKRIGNDKATEFLTKSSVHYHGKFYYFFLTWVLRIGQKLGRVKNPISHT